MARQVTLKGKPLNLDEIRFAGGWIYLAVFRFGGGSDSIYASIEYDYCGAGQRGASFIYDVGDINDRTYRDDDHQRETG